MGIAFGGAIAMVILACIVSVPVFMILKAWIVDTTLEAPIALGLLFGVLGLFGFSWATAGTGWMLCSVALLIACSIGIPIWCTRQEKIDFRELRDDDIGRYRRAIEFDPKNSSAYVFLGDALMERGSCVAAIAQYEKALELAPENDKYKRKLRNAREAESSKKN